MNWKVEVTGTMLSRGGTQSLQNLLFRFLYSLLYGAFEKQMAALRSHSQMKAWHGLFLPGKEQEEGTEPRWILLCTTHGQGKLTGVIQSLFHQCRVRVDR